MMEGKGKQGSRRAKASNRRRECVSDGGREKTRYGRRKSEEQKAIK